MKAIDFTVSEHNSVSIVFIFYQLKLIMCSKGTNRDYRYPVGARLPIVLECSFVFVAPGIALGSKYRLNVYMGACLVGSAITLILWTLFHKALTKMFKPYITGSVVMVLGISLCSTGISYCAGGSDAADFGDPVNLLLAAGTITFWYQI